MPMTVDGDSNTPSSHPDVPTTFSGSEHLTDALDATEQNSDSGPSTKGENGSIFNTHFRDDPGIGPADVRQDQLDPCALLQHAQSDSLTNDPEQPVSLNPPTQNYTGCPISPGVSVGQPSLTHNESIDSSFIRGSHDLLSQHHSPLIPPYISGGSHYQRRSPVSSTSAEVSMGDICFQRLIENIDSLVSPQDVVSDIMPFPNIMTDPPPVDTTFTTKWRVRTSKEVHIEGRL